MLTFLQNNWGTLVAALAVLFIVFLSVRRMVLDKKAGIGICGQKCSKCAKALSCPDRNAPEAPAESAPAGCNGVCSGCKYASSCGGNKK